MAAVPPPVGGIAPSESIYWREAALRSDLQVELSIAAFGGGESLNWDACGA